MAQHHRARLLARDALDIEAEPFRDAAQSPFLARQRRTDDGLLATTWLRAFGHHDDAEASSARVTIHDLLAHLVEVPLDLGNEDHVGRARDAGMQRDESRFAP